MKFNELLTQRMDAAGLSILQVATYLAVAPQAVYNWRNGRVTPGLENIVLLSRLLKFTFDDMEIDKKPSEYNIDARELARQRRIGRLKAELAQLEAQS